MNCWWMSDSYFKQTNKQKYSKTYHPLNPRCPLKCIRTKFTLCLLTLVWLSLCAYISMFSQPSDFIFWYVHLSSALTKKCKMIGLLKLIQYWWEWNGKTLTQTYQAFFSLQRLCESMHFLSCCFVCLRQWIPRSNATVCVFLTQSSLTVPRYLYFCTSQLSVSTVYKTFACSCI